MATLNTIQMTQCLPLRLIHLQLESSLSFLFLTHTHAHQFSFHRFIELYLFRYTVWYANYHRDEDLHTFKEQDIDFVEEQKMFSLAFNWLYIKITFVRINISTFPKFHFTYNLFAKILNFYFQWKFPTSIEKKETFLPLSFSLRTLEFN